jgi:uncharacterized membrane protein YdbT with pleckstrin-like domain
MWEVRPYLQPGEKIEYLGKPSFAGYWLQFLIAIILVLTIWLSLLGILVILFIFILRESTKYIITNKRVALRTGIISTEFTSAEYSHITSVIMDQGQGGKLFDYGCISIKTLDSGEDVDFRWVLAEHPANLKHMIENHIS